MKTIIIKTQEELDALPDSFNEFTVIEIRSPENIVITIRKAWESSRVVARESSRVEAWGSSSVVARESSRVVARESSSVVAWESSSVEAWGSSRVVARESSSVVARESSSVEAWGSSRVVAWGSSSVVAWGSSRVEAWGSSRVVARESSRVVARQSSSVVARESSSVEAWGSSRVEAWGSSRVEAWGSSRVEAWGSSRVVAYDFSMITVLIASVVIKKLMDYSVLSSRGFNPTVEEKADTATIIQTPNKINRSFEQWLNQGYVHADGIIKKLISKKTIGEFEIFEVEEFLERKSSYVVKRGDIFSHGETVEKAIEDFRYKIADRDTSKYSSWKLEDEKPVDEIIQAYRAITGACEMGTKQFVEGLKELPKVIKLKEVVKITKGAFGSREFAGFFK